MIDDEIGMRAEEIEEMEDIEGRRTSRDEGQDEAGGTTKGGGWMAQERGGRREEHGGTKRGRGGQSRLEDSRIDGGEGEYRTCTHSTGEP
eukprot:7173011-Pyramimonas_sp.AAC.1